MEKRKKKVQGKPTRTLDSVKDERFKQILKNPVYRPVPKKEKKVEIDKRFQAMFKDEKFKLKYKVDKRGRPVETTTDENLKRYYNLEGDKDAKGGLDEDEKESSAEEDSSDSDVEGDVKEEDIRAPLAKESRKKLDEVTRKKLRSSEIDYARGEADFVSEESSSDDDDSSDTEEEAVVEHDWGELDKDADRTEESTRRLALCNMDWDRVRAVDLLVLLSSFLPPGGVLKSVKIYPSEFGKQRLAEEEVQGPKELLANGGIKQEKLESDDDDDDGDDESDGEEDDEGEGSQYHREKLRQYQLNRLKYFYAVAEFDSRETAEKVYSECDGMEYESSAAKVDLRFIPEDMTFEEEDVKDECRELPDATKYRPRFFTTTALQQVKVDLTWDETDPLRKELTEKIFDPKEKVDDDDIRAYLATSSESESEEEEDEPAVVEQSKGVKGKDKDDAISKYKALMIEIEAEEKKKKEKDWEMEITWGVGLKENTEKLVKKKLEEEEKAKRTPWEELLDKQKDKKKKKKLERKRKASDDEEEDSEGAGDDEAPFSDDDVDVDMNDEFFKEELRENDIFKKDKKKKEKTKDHQRSKDKREKDEGGKDAALELLLMDEDDNKKHFSLKKILEEENSTKSKKKRRGKKKRKLEGEEAEASSKKTDDFEIDVEDNRFSALFTSHHFNVDPSDPNFKKTKAMERIIEEKQKRRGGGGVTSGNDNSQTSKSEVEKKSARSHELSFMVNSIKRKTETMKSKSKNAKFKFKS